jgi:hypothetical protein
VARVRLKLPGSGWTDKVASPAWVEDLIREDIIEGPHPVRKTEGRGLGQRFAPKDYRDLLRIVGLKSQAVSRRSAWIAHLWLAGRDYPIPRVRDAFRAEIQKLAKGALKDFAPRERLNAEPFGKRYDRRVRQRNEDSLYPELVDIIEPVAALGIARRFLPQIATKPEDIIRLITEITGSPANNLSPMISELISSLKEARLPSIETQRQLATFVDAIAKEHGLGEILQSQEFADAAAQTPAYDDMGNIYCFGKHHGAWLPAGTSQVQAYYFHPRASTHGSLRQYGTYLALSGTGYHMARGIDRYRHLRGRNEAHKSGIILGRVGAASFWITGSAIAVVVPGIGVDICERGGCGGATIRGITPLGGIAVSP